MNKNIIDKNIDHQCIYDSIGPERREIWRTWDLQTRLFAKYFLQNANLPATGQFTLLDAGCGLGSALQEINKVYPQAVLYGLDNDSDHYGECVRLHSEYASFMRRDISEIRDSYDVIYISNVIEHLANWRDVLRHLVDHCSRLYVLVPFRETMRGLPITREMGLEHVNYFDKGSFNYLSNEQVSIEKIVIRTPYAWGHPLMRETRLRIKALLRNEPFDLQREILVSFTKTNKRDSLVPLKPFKHKLFS